MNDKMSLDDFLESYLKRRVLEKDYIATIWLAFVDRFYNSQYKYDLGFNRGQNKKPRKYRPSIIISKNKKGKYKVIFLTTSNAQTAFVNLEQCSFVSCRDIDFKWVKKAYIFSRNGKSVFVINKEDFDMLLKLCGDCERDYIEQLKRYIYAIC